MLQDVCDRLKEKSCWRRKEENVMLKVNIFYHFCYIIIIVIIIKSHCYFNAHKGSKEH